MIWESITLMTAIDVAVVGAVGFAFWIFYHQRRNFPGPTTFHGFSVLLPGLLSIPLFYLFDLAAMHLLPLFVPMSKSMGIMEDLHLNYHWILTLFAVVAITTGFSAIGTGVFAITDITERKRAEKALQNAHDVLESRVKGRTRELSGTNRELEREIAKRRQPQDFYKTVLYAAPDPIVTMDRDAKIVVVGGQVERVFGYGSEEPIGQSVEILLSEHLRGRHVRHRNDYFGDPQVRPMGVNLELVARCKDGREPPVEISLSPVRVKRRAT